MVEGALKVTEPLSDRDRIKGACRAGPPGDDLHGRAGIEQLRAVAFT